MRKDRSSIVFSNELLKRFIFLLAFTALTSCASTPQRGLMTPSTSLNICPGMRVSNAPSTNSSHQIVNYTVFKQIRSHNLLRAPVRACLSSGFGKRSGGAGSFHKGIDLYTKHPQPIMAAATGRIKFAGKMRGFGRTIIIDHGKGVQSLYAHMSEFSSGINPGRAVHQGERLGLTGNTGNAKGVHLHFEIRVNDQPINPLS